MTTTSRRSGPVAISGARRRYRRIDWLLLRWQARLDTNWADRMVPWAAAVIIFVVYFAIALARLDRLEGDLDLARAIQAAWHLSAGRIPETTIAGDVNYFAIRFPVAFVPLAAVTRLLPTAETLLAAQAGALALGAVPVWFLARRVGHMRVGAAAALVVAYACHPAVIDLDLADFHPGALAITPLLVAAYSAERRRWGRFAVASILTMALSSELGLVIAAMGVMLFLERERRVGSITVAGGLLWTVVALFAVQAPLGAGLVGPGAFDRYGDSGLDVLIAMVRNPFRPLGELFVAENVRIVVWILAPLVFLPVLAFRKLIPALPLTALYFVATVPVEGAAGGARTVPMVAFAFVAAPFALARLGRRSIERILVDRGLLALVVSAAVAALLTSSALAPDRDPFRRDAAAEADLRVALDAVPPLVSARVPAAMATELAERRRLEILEPGEADPDVLTDGAEVVVLDESTLEDLDEHARFLLRRRIEDRGFTLVERAGALDVFVRD